MNATEFEAVARLLEASGPYGLVVALAWAFWKINEKKDRELKALHERIATLAEAQTAAIVKVEAALVALRAVIVDMRRTN